MHSASSDFDRKAAELTHTVAEFGHKAIDFMACLAAVFSCMVGSFEAVRHTFPSHWMSIGIAYQQFAQSLAKFAAFASVNEASSSSSNSLRDSRSD